MPTTKDSPLQPPNGASVRYRRSYRRCGKPSCSTCVNGKGHGPYWYAHWRDGKRVRSRYVGTAPPEVKVDVDFRVTTLGRLTVTKTDGNTPTLTGRVREMFTFLLSTPYGSVGREDIAETMWPERDPVTADQNVRVTLASLRRCLGNSQYVRVVGPSLLLALPLGSRDDQMFEASARDALATDRPETMERALNLFTGIYLPEDLYSDWTIYRRQVIGDLRRALVMRAISHPAGPQLKRIEWLRQLLAEDAADEDAAEQLMLLLVASRRRSEALRVLARLEEAMQHDLNVEPSIGLRELARTIRA
jgi:DNA-binding SARP family transcriptional activator